MIKHAFSKKGFILVGMLCFALLLVLVIIPLVSWSVNEFFWTSRSFMSLQALNLADAGAELAVWNIAYNNEQFTSWSGTNPRINTLSSFKDNDNNAIGDISISVDQTAAHRYTVTSTGLVPNAAKPVTEKTVKVLVFPKTLFNNAVFGNQSVTLSGITLVDSYNSSEGPYSSISAGSNGDIGTNGTLTMIGNASVKGDALIAPGGTSSGVESRITGEVFYSAETTKLDVVTLPDYFSVVPLSPDLILTDDTETITTGNYYYQNISLSSDAILTIASDTNIYISQSISITGSAKIITGSNVKFYVSGDGNFAGQGIVNATGVPSDLQIYGLDAGTTLTYAGGSDFYGTIYGPTISINTSGGSNIFGAIVGNNVTLSGTGALHYDENLRENGPSDGFTIVYWQEN